MRRILVTLTMCLLALSCGMSPEQKDIALVTDFYERVLGNKPISDEYLQETLSDDILQSIWEADYEDTYSFWVFRTGYQDGPSDHSTVNSVKPLGEGWYRVDYSDLGNPGRTDVQVSGGKICAYRSMNEN